MPVKSVAASAKIKVPRAKEMRGKTEGATSTAPAQPGAANSERPMLSSCVPLVQVQHLPEKSYYKPPGVSPSPAQFVYRPRLYFPPSGLFDQDFPIHLTIWTPPTGRSSLCL